MLTVFSTQDALSYLDQVKVQFHEQPDVYNKFLDIMKDFKSQTYVGPPCSTVSSRSRLTGSSINTPGVITRVSELFAGHPNLIQGFNTFLPPGYRIECGLENNPNSIRVTTPQGSTSFSIGGSRAPQLEPTQPTSGPGQAFLSARPGNWPPSTVQHSIESPEVAYSVPAQNGPAGFPGSNQNAPFENASPIQQRSVPAGQNGAVGTHAGPAPRNAHTPTPTVAGQPNSNGSVAHQAIIEKRGPVEFNHAISYVNKIKVSAFPLAGGGLSGSSFRGKDGAGKPLWRLCRLNLTWNLSANSN